MADWAPGNHLGQPLEDGLSARALLSSIRRHLFLVLTSTFLLAVGGYLIGLGQPAWFKAEGVVVIHSRPHRLLMRKSRRTINFGLSSYRQILSASTPTSTTISWLGSSNESLVGI